MASAADSAHQSNHAPQPTAVVPAAGGACRDRGHGQRFWINLKATKILLTAMQTTVDISPLTPKHTSKGMSVRL